MAPILTAAALALLCLGGTAQAQPAVLPVTSLGVGPGLGGIGGIGMQLDPTLSAPPGTTVTGMDGRCAPMWPGPVLTASMLALPGVFVAGPLPLVMGQPYSCDATIHWSNGAQSRAQALPDVVLWPDPAVTPPAATVASDPVPTAGPQSVTLHFPPLADPGITGYIAMCIDGPTPGPATLYRHGIAASSPVTVTGLQAGVEHMCAIRPYNAGGAGPVVLATATAIPLAAPATATPVPTLGEWALALLMLAAGALGIRALRGRQGV